MFRVGYRLPAAAAGPRVAGVNLRTRILIAAVIAAAAGLAVAPIGHAAAGAGAAAVKTRHAKLGTFLVDGQGRTLYLFQKDRTRKSTCSGDCAAAWPPVLTTGAPKGAGGARKALLGTTRRADGTTQVTYQGQPLYRFAQDAKPGDLKGQGVNAFGARWYAVAPSGRRLGGGY
jgi:predicted lipoprotein with Yx(FWY)xxD motif